jgi:hypothetical protein
MGLPEPHEWQEIYQNKDFEYHFVLSNFKNVYESNSNKTQQREHTQIEV